MRDLVDVELCFVRLTPASNRPASLLVDGLRLWTEQDTVGRIQTTKKVAASSHFF